MPKKVLIDKDTYSRGFDKGSRQTAKIYKKWRKKACLECIYYKSFCKKARKQNEEEKEVVQNG